MGEHRSHRSIDAGERPVVVRSALSGVSDRLETIIAAIPIGRAKEAVAALHDHHLSLAHAMEIDAGPVIGDELTERNNRVQGASMIGEVSPRLHARLMPLGERMSTKLGTAHLRTQGMAC